MPEQTKTRIAVIVALFFIAVYSPITLAAAQTTRTNTLTQTTSVYSTNVEATTVTSPTTAYTTTTQTMNSTIQGTLTQIVPSLTTVTTTFTSALGGAVTATSTIILTTVLTQTTQILGSIWGMSFAAVVFVGAIASYLIPKAASRRPKGVVCRSCGALNPPFAKAFCVKCGHQLKESV